MRRLATDIWLGMQAGRARVGLTFFSLMLGLFAITILLAAFAGLQRQARDLTDAFGANALMRVRTPAAEGAAEWHRHQVDLLRENLTGEAWVAGIKWLVAGAEFDFPVGVSDAELARARGWRWVAGRAWDAHDEQSGARHVVASAELCREKHWGVGQLLTLGGEVFRLTGIFEPTGVALEMLPEQRALFILHSADYLEAGDEEARGRVDAVLLRGRGGEAPGRLQRRAEALMAQPGGGGGEGGWISAASLLRGIRHWQRVIAWTAGTGGAFSLLLGAAMLAGMLLSGVRERVPEIGLRRALGARRRDIAALFVAEALVLTVAAALCGMALAEGMLRGVGAYFPLPFYFGAFARLLPLALAVVLGLFCSIGPAGIAARMPPAEALRNE